MSGGVEDQMNLDPPLWSRNYGEKDERQLLMEETNGLEAVYKQGPAPTVTWQLHNAWHIQTAHLIVACTHVASTFLYGVLSHSAKDLVRVATLTLPISDVKSTASCDVYVVKSQKKNTLVALCRQIIPQVSQTAFASHLLNTVRPSKVTILDSVALLGGESVQAPALRVLRSDRGTSIATGGDKKNKNDHVCPYLKAPSMVTGLSATFLAYCQVFDLDACLYVSQMAPLSPQDTMHAYLPIFIPSATTASSSSPATATSNASDGDTVDRINHKLDKILSFYIKGSSGSSSESEENGLFDQSFAALSYNDKMDLYSTWYKSTESKDETRTVSIPKQMFI